MKHLRKDMLKWVAAAFALVATATAEYELARAIGMNEWVAAAVPGALDAYVVRALRAHREVLTAVLAMVAVNAASHLVTAGTLPVEWPLITAVSAIAPLVLWRVHALGTPGEARARVLWGYPWRARTDEHTSTETCPDCEHGHEHGVLPSTEPDHAGTDQDLVRAQTDSWGDDWLDVHDAVHTSTTPVPVHAPYADHVTEHTSTRHLAAVPDVTVHTSTAVCTACEHTEHAGGICEHGFCACAHGLVTTEHTDEHTSTPLTAEEWNQAHVNGCVLDPEDVEHMDRARELFHTTGGVPTFRALKEGAPGMGTPRAKRIREALKIEEAGAL